MNKIFQVIIFKSLLISFLFVICISCDNKNTKIEVRKENGMVLIPSGTLNMGGDNGQADKNEFPKHEVLLNSFWMDETEVTNKQFSDCNQEHLSFKKQSNRFL